MKQHLRRGVVCLAVAAAAVSVAACDVKVGEQGMSFDVVQGKATDEWTRSYTLPEGGRLEIVSAGGPVHLSASSDPTVQIRIVREARAASDDAARQALEDETIDEQVEPERVRVATIRRAGSNAGPLGRRRISTETHVSIPAGLHVSAKGENAEITLAGVDGWFTLENTNGGFRGSGISGAVEARTVNGAVQLDFANVTGDITATTVNGPVRIGLPESANVTLDATTVNGGVVVDDTLRFKATQRERRKMTGQINDGGPKIVLQTTNGPVRVGVSGATRGPARRPEPAVVERELKER